MDAEATRWPARTRGVMDHLRAWFQGKGYLYPADLILAFITTLELIRRKGGPVVLAPEAAVLEQLAKEVFGHEVVAYWAPESSQE